MDPRHEKRIKVVQELYSLSFSKKNEISEKVKLINKNSSSIEKNIRKFAPKFPVDKIAKVDLAILKLALYELLIEKKEPPKVIINEAVDLAREMGSDKAYAFVNAVLGSVYGELEKTYDKLPKKS